MNTRAGSLEETNLLTTHQKMGVSSYLEGTHDPATPDKIYRSTGFDIVVSVSCVTQKNQFRIASARDTNRYLGRRLKMYSVLICCNLVRRKS